MNKFFLLMYSFILSVQLFSMQEKHIIGHHGRGGLFSIFFGVLNNLAWAEKNNKIPAVYWGSENAFYNAQGYNGTYNVWEYYFEPVSHAAYQPGEFIHHNYWPPDQQLLIPLYWVPNAQDRSHIKKNFLDKYIKINRIVTEKINNFFNQNMLGKKTIGIHLRGTDKYVEIRPFPIDTILYEANKYSALGYQFLIATDEERYLTRAKQLLQGKVIFYDSFRSTDGHPIHTRYNKAKFGEDVLIEVQLLSQCNLFMHTVSNVSTAVLLFNPELNHICFRA